jgi:hypothetical protein
MISIKKLIYALDYLPIPLQQFVRFLFDSDAAILVVLYCSVFRHGRAEVGCSERGGTYCSGSDRSTRHCHSNVHSLGLLFLVNDEKSIRIGSDVRFSSCRSPTCCQRLCSILLKRSCFDPHWTQCRETTVAVLSGAIPERLDEWHSRTCCSDQYLYSCRCKTNR